MTPAYVGRPAIVAGDGDVAAPLGESPRLRTRSYGVSDCTRIGFDPHGRLVTACGSVLRLLDPDSLRQLASKDLPDDCPLVFAVAGDGVLVGAGDQLLTIATADAEGDPDLTTAAAVDLPDTGCPTGVGADRRGRAWFSSADGRVGLVDGDRVRTLDLDDTVDRPLTVTDDAVYVAGAHGLHKVIAARGRPMLAWTSAYDGGERGSAPVVLPSGQVAVADDRSPRLQVVVHRGDTGAVSCRVELFDDDHSSTDGGHGRGRGRAAGAQLPRVRRPAVHRARPHHRPAASPGSSVAGDECRVDWESDLDAPSGAPAVSTDAGLAYAYTKRHSWLGADAWYLTALDLRTGHAVWARRTGLGLLRDNHGGAVALGPDGTAYVPVLGGFVSVRDRS